MSDLAGSTVLVIGAAGGIGRAICAEFAGSGAGVVAADTDPAVEELPAALSAAGPDPSLVRALCGDGADPAVLDRALALGTALPGRLHTLVYAAFSSERGPVADISEDGWARTHEVSFTGARRAAAAFTHALGGTPGVITFISSVHAFRAHPGFAAYAVAKAGLVALARALAVELGPVGVRANAVAPGFVCVPRNAQVWTDPEALAEVAEQAPLRRAGQPGDISGVVAFLSSPAAAFLTGECITVDGGVLAQFA